MHTTSYRRVSGQLHRRLQKGQRPAFFQFELTFRCNQRCVHCYVPAEWLAGSRVDEELSTREACNLIDQIAGTGAQWLTFTGGNPLLRHDFLDLFDHAKRKGLLVSVMTNLSALDEEICRSFDRQRPFVVEVTLNSLRPRTHDAMTGVPGSLAAALDGLEHALKHKLPLKVKTKATSMNRRELVAISDFLKGHGKEFHYNTTLLPTLDGGQHPLGFRLRVNEVLDLPRTLGAVPDIEEPPPGSASTRQSYYNCGIGTWSYSIDPTGKLFPCTCERRYFQDARSEPLAGALRALQVDIARQTFLRPTKCRGCPERALCPWCPAKAFLETGDDGAPIPYYCELARRHR